MIGTGVKTGMEVSGWDVGTQLLEDVTLTAMEGKDVSFKSSFDKIDPSIAASLFAGSFLLGFGGKAGGELIKGVFGKAKGKITEKIFEAVNTKGVVADNARAANVKLKADDLLDDFIKSQN